MIVEKTLIEDLKKEAETNRVAREVFVVLANRKRDSSMLTVKALKQYMASKGFLNEQEDYERFIEFLAKIKIGKIMKASTGKTLGIKEITLSLVSLGMVAVNGDYELKNFSPKPHYQRLELPKHVDKPKQIETKQQEMKAKLFLTIELYPGKRVEIPVPKDFDEAQIAGIIKRLL